MRITALEERVFAIHAEPLETSPAESNAQVPQAPDLLLQRTKTGNWTVLEEGSFTLNAQELKRLGRSIEQELPNKV